MQTVFPGEEKLKRRLIRQMWKEKIVNVIKKILGLRTEQKTEEPPDNDKI